MTTITMDRSTHFAFIAFGKTPFVYFARAFYSIGAFLAYPARTAYILFITYAHTARTWNFILAPVVIVGGIAGVIVGVFVQERKRLVVPRHIRGFIVWVCNGRNSVRGAHIYVVRYETLSGYENS